MKSTLIIVMLAFSGISSAAKLIDHMQVSEVKDHFLTTLRSEKFRCSPHSISGVPTTYYLKSVLERMILVNIDEEQSKRLNSRQALSNYVFYANSDMWRKYTISGTQRFPFPTVSLSFKFKTEDYLSPVRSFNFTRQSHDPSNPQSEIDLWGRCTLE